MANAHTLRFLAHYLPQFHPTPENDQWWGRGFTEWTNVARGRSLFRNHYQPHVPADLGFYDLRLPETRAAQAALARQYGIDGFCYYHYWFHGRRLLGRPLDEVLRSGEPDFPFCLCWANENWTRTWSGGHHDILAAQTYSREDDLRHIHWLAGTFADPRYIRIGGRPLFLVYRPAQLPDPLLTTERWRSEAVRLGIGDLYLCAVESFPKERRPPADLGFDAAVQFAPDRAGLGPRLHDPGTVGRAVRRYLRPKSPYRASQVHDYRTVVDLALSAPPATYLRYPSVTPGWDNSARRPGGGALVLVNSSPGEYERWVRGTIERARPRSVDENLVFINAWNEWAEGNHLEPCRRWGRAYLEAHARAVGSSLTTRPMTS